MTEEDSTLLRATLVPVARDLEAKAGQRLLIVAGVCVGVYTGDKPPRAQAARAEPAARPPAKPPAPQPRRSSATLPIAQGGTDNPERAAMRAKLLAAMERCGGELYAFELTRELGPGDNRRGYLMRCAVADLEAEGAITIGGKGGKGRLYRLTRHAPAPPEETVQ